MIALVSPLNLLSALFQNPIIAFILLVGIVVFIHESGHFLAGRMLGVDVEEFSLGFGPKAFGFKRGNTEYKICWLPLGGYVRFYGAEIGQDVPLAKRERAITTAKLYKRAIISIAGPFANFILSLVIMIVLSNVGMPQAAPVVSVVPGGVAEKAGFKTGDRIVKIDEMEVKTWADLNKKVRVSAGKSLHFTLERGTENVTLDVTPQADQTQSPYGEQVNVGRIGVSQFLLTPRLVVAQGSVWDQAGLHTGDMVLAVQGKKIRYRHELEYALEAFGSVKKANPAATLEIIVHKSAATGIEQLSGELKQEATSLKKDEAFKKSDDERGAGSQKFPDKTEEKIDEKIKTVRLSALAFGNAVAASVLSTDLMVQNYDELKRGDKRIPAAMAWQNCGLHAGDTLTAIEGVGVLQSPLQLSIWLQKMQTTLTAQNLASETPVAVGISVLNFAGAQRQLNCSIPVRAGKDSLNRDQVSLDFPVMFLTHGVPVEPVLVQSSSFAASLTDGAQAAWEQVSTIATGLRKLVTGSVPMANLGGPIAIARVAGDAAEGGLGVFVLTISWMSMNIGLFNLLPLPALDGGTLLLYGVEAAYGKPLPPKVQGWVLRVGIVFILCLMVLVFYNDILRLFHS